MKDSCNVKGIWSYRYKSVVTLLGNELVQNNRYTLYVCMYVNHSYRIDIILILIVHTFDIFVILLKTDTEYMTVHFVFVTSNQTICFESQLYLKV